MEIQQNWHLFGVLWQDDGEEDLQIALFLVHDVLGRHFGAGRRFLLVFVCIVVFWCGGDFGMVIFAGNEDSSVKPRLEYQSCGSRGLRSAKRRWNRGESATTGAAGEVRV
jgi:hypothetical protein